MAKKTKNNKKASLSYDYTLYTDGGCLCNPGGTGGCAAIILNQEKEFQEFSEGYQSTTNNRMEIMAVILGLQKIPTGSRILAYSDSQYVVNTINGRFAKKKNHDLWQLLDEASIDKCLDIQWIRGHQGNHYNERCDELCSIAMRQKGLLKDVGYYGKKSSKKTGAMGVVYTLPKEYQAEEMASLSSKEYCEIYHVNPECGEALAIFRQKQQHSFKDYLNLKTGGLDAYSRISKAAILKQTELSPEALKIIEEVLPSTQGQMCCIRWYMRGLPLADCIRKALVDEEICQNKF